jgi:hypothetical protein
MEVDMDDRLGLGTLLREELERAGLHDALATLNAVMDAEDAARSDADLGRKVRAIMQAYAARRVDAAIAEQAKDRRAAFTVVDGPGPAA